MYKRTKRTNEERRAKSQVRRKRKKTNGREIRQKKKDEERSEAYDDEAKIIPHKRPHEHRPAVLMIETLTMIVAPFPATTKSTDEYHHEERISILLPFTISIFSSLPPSLATKLKDYRPS
ncbi:hypothetical protein BLNAU_18785 [Blattamonas nauphoetae]|uniref:Uncharacterized protein n=1 Tax=Blattamonas nauphoetae TaxID=2049346 RepID=A0ABQ9X3C2_9EUKA|nr:hypothetical protein BLNAU_18785 [Blattamonas nauphoetae]